MENEIWDRIAAAYSNELKTSTEEVHFGVGIPGNKELNLIQQKENSVAVDLGCGSGENLVALSRLGYRVVGLDSSELQLARARNLLEKHAIEATLFAVDVGSDLGVDLPTGADLVLSVGVAHFCQSLPRFIGNCRRLLKINGVLVLSLPHPLDMLARIVELGGSLRITVDSYFPPERQIENAHYWQQFAGRIKLASGLREFLCRPSDVIASMLDAGFELDGLWEPQYTGAPHEPCLFVNPDKWFSTHFYPSVPQYLIVRAVFRGGRDND